MSSVFKNLLYINSNDADIQRRGRNALIMQYGLIALAILTMPIEFLLQGTLQAVVLYNIVPILLATSALFFLRRGQVNSGAIILILLQAVPMLISLYALENVRSIFFMVMLPVLFASLTLQVRYIWLSFVLILIGSIFAMELNPYHNLQENAVRFDLVLQALFGLILTVMSTITAHAIQSALAHDRQNRMKIEHGLQVLEATKLQLEQTIARRTAELEQSLLQQAEHENKLTETIADLQASQRAFQELNVPLLPVLPGVIVAIIVGILEMQQATDFIQKLLHVVEKERIQTVICDVTAMPSMDESLARLLFQTTQSIELLGARLVFVGIRPELAELIAKGNFSFEHLEVFADLEDVILSLLPSSGTSLLAGKTKGSEAAL